MPLYINKEENMYNLLKNMKENLQCFSYNPFLNGQTIF